MEEFAGKRECISYALKDISLKQKINKSRITWKLKSCLRKNNVIAKQDSTRRLVIETVPSETWSCGCVCKCFLKFAGLQEQSNYNAANYMTSQNCSFAGT